MNTETYNEAKVKLADLCKLYQKEIPKLIDLYWDNYRENKVSMFDPIFEKSEKVFKEVEKLRLQIQNDK